MQFNIKPNRLSLKLFSGFLKSPKIFSQTYKEYKRHCFYFFQIKKFASFVIFKYTQETKYLHEFFKKLNY